MSRGSEDRLIPNQRARRLDAKSAFSAAVLLRRRDEDARRRARRRVEVHVDARDLVAAELDVARAGAVVARAARRRCGSARSDDRPPRSPAARRTPPPSVCRRWSRPPPRRRPGTGWRASAGRRGSTRPRASPDASTTAGTRCTGMPRNRSYGMRLPSSSTASFDPGSSDTTRRSGTNAMPRSAKPARIASEVDGDGGIGAPNGITTRIVTSSRTPRSRRNSSQQERRLARRRRALERRAADADDRVPRARTTAARRAASRRRPRSRTRCRPPRGPASRRRRSRRPAPPPGSRPRTHPASVTTRRVSGSIDVMDSWRNRTPGFARSP